MEMVVNGTVASTGVGAAALGNPLNAAAWLAQTLAGRGEPPKAGDTLLAGAPGAVVALKPGDHVPPPVRGIGAGSVPHRGEMKSGGKHPRQHTRTDIHDTETHRWEKTV